MKERRRRGGEKKKGGGGGGQGGGRERSGGGRGRQTRYCLCLCVMTANKDWSGKTTGDLYWGNPCVRDLLAANKLSSSSSPFDATGWAKANALTTPLLHFRLVVAAKKGGGGGKGAGMRAKTWGGGGEKTNG